ncbi:MAG: LURP-one-related/scramblase family protein, partial [Halobaculum sp.]
MSRNKYDISRLTLDGDSYTVEQALVRNKYKAMDEAGNVVLRGKQKMLKMKESFPFTDGDGTDVFTVEAGGIMDVAGNYSLVDAETDEAVIVLDNDFSLFQDTWRVRDPDTEEVLAQIDSRGALTTLARDNLPFGGLIPHKYEITDGSGAHVGRIDGQLSIKDRYEISIDDASDVPKEAIVAVAMVIDAI